MAVVLTAALTFPVPMAHTVTELEQWQADWNGRAMHSLDVGMMTERREMRANHKWFFDPQPKEVHHRNHTSGDVTAPPPGNTGMGSDVEQWRGLVAAYFPPDQVDRALRVLGCETGWTGNPWAKNPTSSAAGLFQFLRSTWDRVAIPLGYGSYDSGAVYDPVANVHAASVLSSGGSNWSQWSCKP